MTKFFASFLKDESGAAAAEYALILAVVTGGIAIAAVGLGDAIETAITTATDEINNPGS
jgi:pilus assembly protein Flp/PilA